MLIDTHNHIYLKAFDNDRPAILERMQGAGVEKCYMPGIDSEVWEDMLKTQASYENCLAMPGLHPCSVKENYKEELAFVEEKLSKATWPAVGEIGLDYYWDTSFAEQQKIAFGQQMDLALQYELPVVIHTRNAMDDAIEMVKPFAQKGLRGIFHCFSGTAEQANAIISMDFLLGIGGVLTYKNSGVAQAIEHINLKNIVLETDAPYLAPVPFRGKRNEPAYLVNVVTKLAETLQVTEQEVAVETSRNAINLYTY